jgi:PKHD-type hydroxylase
MNSNIYYAMDRMLEANSCDAIVEQNKDIIVTGATFGSEDGGAVRKSKVAFMSQGDSNYYDALWDIGKYLNRVSGWNYDLEGIDDVQFTRYEPNEFYKWHADMNGDIYERHIAGIKEVDNPRVATHPDKIGKTRKMSMSIQLSDPEDYEGGSFELATLDTDQQSDLVIRTMNETRFFTNKGSVIAFPSFVHHKVNPVIKGTRYSLVVWFYGRPFK